MPALNFRLYAAGLAGLTLTDHVIGTTTHPLVLAVAQEDPDTDSDNMQHRGNWYQLLVPSEATVAIDEETVIPISDTLRFRGKVTQIETDIIRGCRWLTVRGRSEAVS